MNTTQLPKNWQYEAIRDTILNYENKGLGAGLTPREYAEDLSVRIASALERVA